MNIWIGVGAVVVVIAGYLIFMQSDEVPTDEVMSDEMNDTMENDGAMTEEDMTDEEGGAMEEETNSEMSDPEEENNQVGVEVEAQADVEATNREFTLDAFNYGFSNDTITVNEGDTVTITLTSTDGFHDWVIDEFDASTEKISTGDTTSVTFVAGEAGSFEFYCSVGNHRAQGMVGTLVVE